MSDLYQHITNRIITLLEQGTIPWLCPWTSSPEQALPANLSSGHRYSGINVLLLNMVQIERSYPLNRWLSYQQARALGGHVRRGEKGTDVVFFKMMEVDDKRAQTRSVSAHDANALKLIPLLKSFTVFNAAQVDDLPPAITVQQPPPDDFDANAAAELVLQASGASIQHGGDKAFYRPMDDYIQLPPKASFVSSDRYYNVALHELTHWSGHPSRCNRQLASRQNLDAYAFEELIAELGSSYLCNYTGINNKLHHASYIANWLQALHSDKRLIFTAASLAQKAADYLLAPLAALPTAHVPTKRDLAYNPTPSLFGD